MTLDNDPTTRAYNANCHCGKPYPRIPTCLKCAYREHGKIIHTCCMCHKQLPRKVAEICRPCYQFIQDRSRAIPGKVTRAWIPGIRTPLGKLYRDIQRLRINANERKYETARMRRRTGHICSGFCKSTKFEKFKHPHVLGFRHRRYCIICDIRIYKKDCPCCLHKTLNREVCLIEHKREMERRAL